MKAIITFFVLIFAMQLFAITDDDFFLRQGEKAHPTPSPEAQKKYNKNAFKIPYIIQGESKFFNVLTTVDESDVIGIPTQNESSIAVNPNNPNIVISSAVDYRDNSSSWIYISTDGGKTWVNKNLGKANGWRSSNDPSVMFDKDGTGYLVLGAFPASGNGENGVYILKSLDGGLTWGNHIPVIEHTLPNDPLVYFEDKYYIEVDNSDESPYRGDLYIPWKRVTAADSATQIVITKSTDKGETWSVPVNISDRVTGSSEDTTFGQSFPLVSTGPEGNVYAVWNHGLKHSVGFNKSTDGGITWGTPTTIHKYDIFGTTMRLEQGWRHTLKGKVRAEAYPVIKTDYSTGPNRGNVYVAWAADSTPNIYFSKSIDEGVSWSTPKIVHSDTKNDQFWTWMGVDPTTGDIAIMYLDSRNDPDNILVECYLSYSSDGGETWIDRQVSDEPSDIRNNPFSGSVFAGDYSGLDFYDGVIYPSWVDMRNTVKEGGSNADNDVYSAIIRVDQPSPVENFKASINPDEPAQLELVWNTVWESSFGKKLNKSDFELELYKDGKFLITLSAETQSYIDEPLTPYQRYDYKIRAKSVNDSSIFKSAFNYAGGTEKPDSVLINDFEVFSDKQGHISTKLFVQIPNKRADKTTDLTNVKNLNIYGNGKLLREFPLLKEEIGTEVEVNLTKEIGGYTHVNCILVAGYEDDGLGLQYSASSNSVFVYEGPVIGEDELKEINFEDKTDIHYSDEWKITDEIAQSAPNSISTSPNGDYESRKEYSLYLEPTFEPISLTNGESTFYSKFSFEQICQVHNLDSAVVETSDDLKEWTSLKKYSMNDFEQWQDDELKAEDWINSNVLIVGNSKINSLFTRLRLKTNSILNKKGWYIDNIKFSSTKVQTKVEEEFVSELSVYPNPTSNFLNINNYNNLPLSIQLVDMSGNILISKDNYLDKSLNLTNLSSGVYIVKMNYKNHSKIEKITIIK